MVVNIDMVEFTFTDDDIDEFTPPPYGVPGRIMFRFDSITPPQYRHYRWSGPYENLEVLDWDGDTSVFWLVEGRGIEDFIQDCVDLEQPGTYVLEGVVGYYYRGDGWTTDDDEEWDFELCRRAYDNEVENEGF